MGHIIPQIIDFFNAMKNDDVKMKVKYDIKWPEDLKLKIIEAIDKENYEIVVIIDKIDFKIKK